VAACAISAAGIWRYRSRALEPRALWHRLPARDAAVLYIDFKALRRAGLMELFDRAKSPEDPEYLRFVRSTSFDYKRDLDGAMAAFSPTGTFILAKGRFEWSSLRAYAESQQGSCHDSLCRLVGSTPERRISFLPIQSGLMALAVSTDETAAVRLATAVPGPDPEIPDAPVWALLPPRFLLSAANLPDGTRPFARAVSEARSVTLALAPEGHRFALKLSVVCDSDQAANDAAAQMTKMTALLRKLIALEKETPSPGDLSGVLVSGTFRNSGNRASGYWPIERVFIENLVK